jgi:hypothetical protein
MNRVSSQVSKHIGTRTRIVIATGLIIALASGSAFAMGGHNAPCDSWSDCLYTAWWYAFLR